MFLTDAATGLSGIVTTQMMSGVLDEILGLLPVVIPVMIGFIGLRKGISFLQSVLHSACYGIHAPRHCRGAFLLERSF